MIIYRTSVEDISVNHLQGFFEGWPDPPSPETHRTILESSYRTILALDSESDHVVGFITAVSDGVLSAYIPLLEVLPDYRGRGIGRELVQRMLAELSHLYMIDLVCDPELRPFYETLGMQAGTAMMIRNFDLQSGKPLPPEAS